MAPSSEIESAAAVVTGASSGIGREVVHLLVASGKRVAMWARRPDPLAELVGELGDAVVAVQCDVSDPAEVARAMNTSINRLGDIRELVNSAGIAEPMKLEDLDAEAWMRTIDINLNGTYYASRAFAQHVRSASATGSIVNLGSELSSMGMPSYAAYCASKSAVIGLTKALAHELAPAIRVNALCPGPVDTPMWRAELALASDPQAALDGERERIPLGRVSEAGEIAEAIVWLLSQARFATGALVPIDGGTTSV